MANENVVVSSRRPRRWLKWLAWLAGGFVVLLVVLYFVATSSAFFKGMILPRASRALNASITVSSASIHPFSEVTLRDVKVQPDGQSPLLTASEVRVRYHLWDIIGGNIRVDEAVLVSPTVELVENPDGSRNLDPILKALQTSSGTAAKPSSPAKSSKPLQIAVGKVVLSDANFRQLKNFGGGHSNLVEVANVNVTLANLMNGQTAKLDLSSSLHVDQNPPAGAAGSLAASFKGNFNCALGADLTPGQVSGGASLAVLSASGSFSNFDALGATLNCDVTPTEIKQ
ncbi:MAG: hypothetical protein P4M10_06330, partial [Verrucomicrobiae bacterium]|nr:hypothetical protein [Verrucomicrobiae bacterium]